MRSYEDSQRIEKALKYLALQIDKSGNNPKPVIFHSVRVALSLDKYGYSTEVVVAALLHDLLEDTETDLEDIEKEFGQEVSVLVEANSFDKSITDKKQRYIEAFDRCSKAGKNAILIKTADILDNADYYSLVEDQEAHKGLVDKFEYFMNLAEEFLKGEPIYGDMQNKHKVLITKG